MDQQSRLSLKRNRYHQLHVKNIISVEISDDESSDSISDPQSNIGQVNCANANPGKACISSDVTDSSNPVCSLTNMHDLSDDLSSDEDIVVVDTPSTSKKTNSMFNWGNTSFAYAPRYQNSTSSVLHDSRIEEEIPKEVLNKKQKLMFDSTNDDDLMSLNNFKEEALPPEVTIQRKIMIAGTNVTFPVEPYPCQKAVMNSVSTIIM